MPTVTVDYYGVSGTGKTVTEAKRDAGRKIEAMLAGDYRPEVLAWRGYAMLLWREPDGWHETRIAAPEGVRAEILYGHAHRERREAEWYARRNLAQLGWVEADGQTVPEILDPKDKSGLSDHRSWAEFQLRCLEGRRRGIPENDLHDWAGRNPWRPELWQKDEPAVA